MGADGPQAREAQCRKSPGHLRTHPPCSGSAGELLAVNPEVMLSLSLHPHPPAGPGAGAGATTAGSCLLASVGFGSRGALAGDGREGGREASQVRGYLLARCPRGLPLCQMMAAPKSPFSVLLSLHPWFLAPPPASEFLCTSPTSEVSFLVPPQTT